MKKIGQVQAFRVFVVILADGTEICYRYIKLFQILKGKTVFFSPEGHILSQNVQVTRGSLEAEITEIHDTLENFH